MTISSTSPRKQYTATGGQTVFAYPFKIFADADLKVYKTDAGNDPDDAADIQTLTTHYTVSGAGDAAGGNVTFVSGLSAGDTVTIVRDIDEERTTDFVDGGDLLAATANDTLDRIIAMIQEANGVIDRAMKIPESASDSIDLVLPTPVDGYFLGWDSNALASLANTDAIIYVGASAPLSSAYVLWYDTANESLKYWDGAAWQTASGTDISGKQDRDVDAVEGNLAEFDANGHTVDAGAALSAYAPLASPNFTGTPQKSGVNLATVNDVPDVNNAFYEFEDTDANIAVSTSASAAIDSQTITIPTVGMIALRSAAFSFSNGATSAQISFGLRIGSNLYPFSNNVAEHGFAYATLSTTITTDGSPLDAGRDASSSLLAIDIESAGIVSNGDTGSQTVELYAIQSGGTGTLLNATVDFRAILEVIDMS